MDYVEHLDLLKKKLSNPVKGVPLNITNFKEVVPFLEKEQRILLVSDSGIGKTSFTLKYFIYDLIQNNINVNIYYFSIELSSVVIYCKIYQYLLALKKVKNFEGKSYSLQELQSPSHQKTIDDISSLKPSLDLIFKKLIIIDSIHTPSGMYAYLKKETVKYGKEIRKPDGQIDFVYHDDQKHVVVITDTINALQNDPGKSEYESVKYWSENYCKLYLSKLYKFIVLNVQQTDNNVKSSSYTNTGMKIEDKHTPTLGNLATVKSTPADHTLVLSLFGPHRYSIKTCDGYSIARLKDRFIKVNILKNNFGQMGPDINAYLYYEGESGSFEDLPPTTDKLLLDTFMTSKGIPVLSVNTPPNIL